MRFEGTDDKAVRLRPGGTIEQPEPLEVETCVNEGRAVACLEWPVEDQEHPPATRIHEDYGEIDLSIGIEVTDHKIRMVVRDHAAVVTLLPAEALNIRQATAVL
jgi:hypothetical protein